MGATSQLCLQFLHPISTSFRKPTATGNFRPTTISLRPNDSSMWALKCSLVEPSQSNVVDVKQLVNFLYDDLPHVFDDQGIDPTAYDERMKFRDPITKIDGLSCYLFNIAFLKLLFKPKCSLHWVKQTGPYEIRTRWTAVMKYALLPWKPELVVTGTSIMGIDPHTGKFCSLVDLWDSIQNNDFFSVEGLLDVLKQLMTIHKNPDMEMPKYEILKRTANYEVRKYAPFFVVETMGDDMSSSSGFNDVAGIRHRTKYKRQHQSSIRQMVLPSNKDLSSLPKPKEENVRVRKMEGGTAAIVNFSGKPSEDIVRLKEKALRSSLVKDGLKPKTGCLLAQYNHPKTTWSFTMRNEVLIWLEEFSLEDG